MAQFRNPLHDLLTLQQQMNNLFEDARQHPRRGTANEHAVERTDWVPAADVYEADNQYVIAIDLPGINRETLDISLDDGRLAIRGTRTIEQEAGREQRAERPFGNFLRRFTVPTMVEQQGVTAEYKDGVLRVRLPKIQEPAARRVEIKVQ